MEESIRGELTLLYRIPLWLKILYTAFMAVLSVFLRGLSLFHGWLPFLLFYLVWRIGYDRRALPAWTLLSFIVLPICYVFMPPAQPDPGLMPVNLNYVWGFSDHVPQAWVPPNVWFLGLLFGLPILIYWPTHLLLRRFMPQAADRQAD